MACPFKAKKISVVKKQQGPHFVKQGEKDLFIGFPP
jgi:hypothetical protein